MNRAFAIAVFSTSVILIAHAQAPGRPQSGRAENKAGSSPTVDSKTLALSDVYLKRLEGLRKLGVTVFYPTFIPDRFSLVSVKTVAESDCPNRDYQLRFCDKKHLCFSIESACGGIGDGPDGDRHLKGKSRVLGPFTIDVFKPGSEGNDTRLVYYLSGWLPDEKMVIATKKGVDANQHGGRYHHFLGHGVTDKEAVAIVESLTPIR